MEAKIIESIQRFYAEEGDVRRREYEKKPYAVSGSTVRKYFGTWTDALKRAGIQLDEQPSKQELKEKIIESLWRYYEEKGKIPQRDPFSKVEYGFSRATIESVFASWSNALVEAKLKEDPKVPTDEQGDATRERILLLLKKFIAENGNERSFHQFQKQGNRIGHNTIKKYFGSWDRAYDLAKFGEQKLYSKKELMVNYNLPENFVRGLQHIPALRDLLVEAGKNGREGSVYKIPEEHVEHIISYYHDLKAKHDFHSNQRGWFTSEEALLSVYLNDDMITKMISNGELIESEEYVVLDRIDWKHINIKSEETPINPTVLYLHRKTFEKFPIMTLGTMLKVIRKRGILTSIETLSMLRNSDFISCVKKIEKDNTTSEYFDIDKTIKALTFYLENAERNIATLSSYDLLSAEQQKLLDQYIESRESGVVIEFDNYSPKRNVAHSDLRLPETRNRLANAFLSIICGRCGVDYKNGRLEQLSEEELIKINPEVFNITDVTMDDYAFIAKHRKTSTLVQRYNDLKPFYSWILMRKDAEPKLNYEAYQQFDALRKNIKNFLNQFPKRQSDAPATEKRDSMVKVFFTREELVKCRDLLLNTYGGFAGLKYATIWMLGATGLRPEEFIHLKLENHFVLDEDGFMTLNDKGYGELIIDRLVGKGSYSTSHPDYNLPVPPDVVKQVNLYLKALYQQQGRHNLIGKGYFIRKHPAAPEKGVKELSKDFIEKLRTVADFLPKEKRENIILKNTRHSMYTLMKKTFTKDDHLRENVKPYALYYQMRHSPQELTTGEKFYLEAISRDDYYAILDHTINFPWKTESLKQWEVEHGFISVEDLIEEEESDEKHRTSTKTTRKISVKEQKQKEELQVRIESINERLAALKTRDKKVSVTEWLNARKTLEKEKGILELKLKSL